MTVLELMIVLAIIGLTGTLIRGQYRRFSKADLVENSTELAAVLKRARLLAIEHGELHRVTIDLDRDPTCQPIDDARCKAQRTAPDYIVEVCRGAVTIARNELVRTEAEAKKRAVEQGTQRMRNLPTNAFTPNDPEEAQRRAIALAGHHVADRECVPATDSYTGDSKGRGWARQLAKQGRNDRNEWSGVHFKEIWIAHRDDSVTKGQVAIYFWPSGSSEKTVVQLKDGDDAITLLVTGLTGRVDIIDGPLQDPRTFMLKNVMGEKDAAREAQK
jgi:hypothetical protein